MQKLLMEIFRVVIMLSYKKSGSGPDVLILPGIFDDSRSYWKLINILSKNYTVYAIDLPGMGNSTNLNTYHSIDNYIKFVKDLNLNNPIIYAHSAGAYIALSYVKHYSYTKLILINPAGFSKLSYLGFVLRSIKKNIYNKQYGSDNDRLLKIRKSNIFRNVNKYFLSFIKNYLTKLNIDGIKNLVIYISLEDELFSFNKHEIKQSNPKVIIKQVSGNHDWVIFKPELLFT